MTDDSMEIVRGSGNVFRDFGYPDADVRQAKALLAAQIIKVLDAEALTTRQAEARTGIAHSEFVRIRKVNLARQVYLTRGARPDGAACRSSSTQPHPVSSVSTLVTVPVITIVSSGNTGLRMLNPRRPRRPAAP